MGKHAHNHGKTRATFKAVIVLHQCALPWETHAKFKAGMVFHPWTRPWENTRYIQSCHPWENMHTTMGKHALHSKLSSSYTSAHYHGKHMLNSKLAWSSTHGHDHGKTRATFKPVMVLHPCATMGKQGLLSKRSWSYTHAQPWENTRYIQICHGLTPIHTTMGKHALDSKLPWSTPAASAHNHGKTRATFKAATHGKTCTQPWENTRYIQSCHRLTPVRTTMGNTC